MTDKDTRGALTDGNNQFTMSGRRFTYVGNGFISDENFDFDASLRINGDFVGDDKDNYCRMIVAALNAAPSLPAGDGLTDEQIMVALESRGVTFKAVYSPSLKADVISTDGSQDARDIIAGIRAVLAATRQPVDVGAGVQLQKALAFIEGIGHDLLQRRCADWYQEGANNAALQMSEDMRLLGNACADFEIGVASAQQDERRTVKFPDAEGNEVSAYLTFDELAQRFRNAADELVELRAGKAAQQDEREAFEAWVAAFDGACANLNQSGNLYESAMTQRAFRAWQARAALNVMRDDVRTIEARAAQQVQADAGAVANLNTNRTGETK